MTTDYIHVNGQDRIILVIFSQAPYEAPWWWILCDPKHVGAILNIFCMRASQMKTLKYFLSRSLLNTKDVPIHDSCPDVRLCHSLLRGDFPSWWLQLLQCPLVSLLGVPDRVEESLLQN